MYILGMGDLKCICKCLIDTNVTGLKLKYLIICYIIKALIYVVELPFLIKEK